MYYHLAGIMMSRGLKTETTDKKDNKIELVAEKEPKTHNAISNKCKIIFPSTHVVYEGIEEVRDDIKENEKTKRFCLSYPNR